MDSTCIMIAVISFIVGSMWGALIGRTFTNFCLRVHRSWKVFWTPV